MRLENVQTDLSCLKMNIGVITSQVVAKYFGKSFSESKYHKTSSVFIRPIRGSSGRVENPGNIVLSKGYPGLYLISKYVNAKLRFIISIVFLVYQDNLVALYYLVQKQFFSNFHPKPPLSQWMKSNLWD